MDERDRERCERLAQAIGEWGAMPDFLSAVRDRGVRGGSPTSVYRYVKAQIVPGIDFLVEAADVLGVRRDWLLFGEGEQTEAEEATRPEMLAMRAMGSERGTCFDDRLEGQGPALAGLVLEVITQLFLADPDGAVFQGRELELLETLILDLASEPVRRFRPADPNPDEIRASLIATLQGMSLAIPGRRQGRPLADIIGAGKDVDLMGATKATKEVQQVLERMDRYIERQIIERRTRPIADPIGEERGEET